MGIRTGLLLCVLLGAPAPARAVDEEVLEQARTLGRTGRHAEAIALYEGLRARIESTDGEDAWPLVFLLHELAVQHHSLGHAADAEALYRRSLAIAERHRGARDAALAPSLRGLAAVAAMQGQLADAEAFYRRALEIQEAAGDGGAARTLAELGLLCQLQERPAEAEAHYRRALELGGARDLSPEETATIAANLASLVAHQGRWAESEALHRRVLEIREGILGPDHPQLAKVLRELAGLSVRQGRFAAATSFYERCLRVREPAAPDDLSLADLLSRLAAAYRKLGRTREAEVNVRLARAILDAQCGGRERSPDCADAIRSHQALREGFELAAGPSPPPPSPPRPAAVDIASAEAPADPDAAPPARAAPLVPRPAAAPAARVYRAQVAARQDRGEADALFEGLRDSFPEVLAGLVARVVRADLGERGVWYRVQLGDFPDAARAKALCAELARRGHEGCWVTAAGSDGG